MPTDPNASPPVHLPVVTSGTRLCTEAWRRYFTTLGKLTTFLTTTLAALGVTVAAITPVEGTWAPVDASGAGLVLGFAGTAVTTTIRRRVWWTAQITYPPTANALPAMIGGLPGSEAVNTAVAIGFQSAGPAGMQARLQGATSLINFTIEVTAAAVTNANLTGAIVVLSGSYRKP